MLRRIFLITAAAAMVTLSALPASAAVMQSGTHKLSFPHLSGVSAWGTYSKSSRGVKVNVCAKDTARSILAEAFNASDADELGAPYLSFGGELRERFESYSNPNFGIKAPAHNAYLLHRLLLHADLHLNDYVRGFVQLGELQRVGVRGVTSTTDIDQLDLMQGFVDIRVPTPLGDAPTLRSGRQEVLLGFQRLVSVREGPNVRRAFDGVRLSDSWNGASIDLLALRPVQDQFGSFNDPANPRQALWGAYATVPVWGGLKADLYWLGYENDAAKFRGQTGEERRQSFGTRLFGNAHGWDWNEEAVLQVGSFRDRDIRAWMLASIIGYTVHGIAWTPRLALEATVASGDNPHNGAIGTFNAMFPRLPYFAETALLVPSNVRDVRPTLTFKPMTDVTVVAAWDTLWRSSIHDSLYGSGMVAYAGTATATAARIGNEASLDIRWRPGRHLTFGLIYSYFLVGPAVAEAHGKDVNYGVLFATYKF